MTPTISKELQEQIEREAEAYADKHIMERRFIVSREAQYHWEIAKEDYIKAASPYAARFEQAKKALDRLKSVADCYSYIPSLNPPIKHLQSIINEALASWKEEGKEGGV